MAARARIRMQEKKKNEIWANFIPALDPTDPPQTHLKPTSNPQRFQRVSTKGSGPNANRFLGERKKSSRRGRNRWWDIGKLGNWLILESSEQLMVWWLWSSSPKSKLNGKEHKSMQRHPWANLETKLENATKNRSQILGMWRLNSGWGSDLRRQGCKVSRMTRDKAKFTLSIIWMSWRINASGKNKIK